MCWVDEYQCVDGCVWMGDSMAEDVVAVEWFKILFSLTRCGWKGGKWWVDGWGESLLKMDDHCLGRMG